VGAPVWSSPEVILEMPWNTATDIWSFGTVVCVKIWMEVVIKHKLTVRSSGHQSNLRWR